MRYGLIGEKLGHSFSKDIHERIADYTFDLIPLSKEEFKTFMEKKEFTALNVTIPYKKDVIPYLDEMDDFSHGAGNLLRTAVFRAGASSLPAQGTAAIIRMRPGDMSPGPNNRKGDRMCRLFDVEIGRASCRERVCQYV